MIQLLFSSFLFNSFFLFLSPSISSGFFFFINLFSSSLLIFFLLFHSFFFLLFSSFVLLFCFFFFVFFFSFSFSSLILTYCSDFTIRSLSQVNVTGNKIKVLLGVGGEPLVAMSLPDFAMQHRAPAMQYKFHIKT